MSFENKLGRFMRDSGPARFFVPLGVVLLIFSIFLFMFQSENYIETVGKITSVTEGMEANQYDIGITYMADGKEYENTFLNIAGKYNVNDDIKVFYDPQDPGRISNGRTTVVHALIVLAAGIASIGFGIFKTVKAFGKSQALDRGRPEHVSFDGFKTNPGVTEYYFRYDGNTLKPGYLIEDANRNVLFEGTMLKNALVNARSYAFRNHVSGSNAEHKIGHTVTQSYNDEFFSVSSWFKYDGENVWDVLHGRGLRMTTNLHSQFPRLIYEVIRDGTPFAIIETCSKYVHEEDEARHRLTIPYGKMYYRIWTDSDDLDSIFLTVFAISETEQTVVE